MTRETRPLAELRIGYIGNFEPPHSTENEYLDAWERAGHYAVPFQEGGGGSTLDALLALLRNGGINLLQWTRTKSLAEKWGDAVQWEILRTAGKAGIPVVGVHLDIWHGLAREDQLRTDPYFRGVDLMLTANGDPDADWEQYNIDHHWLPPGVSERWCHEGTPRDEWRSDIVFTGSWQGGYHPEAEHRHQLVEWLYSNYGDRVKFYPRPGEHAIRGNDLTDLYWSAKVVVGDSCSRPDLTPVPYYCSDRIPETLGRGGFLVHPFTPGVTDTADTEGIFNHEWWHMGNWDELGERIESTIRVADSTEAADYRRHSMGAILEHHTYTKRCEQIRDIMTGRGLL